MIGLIRMVVSLTVDFHRQPRGGAIDVQNVRTRRVLAAKLQPAEGLVFQAKPQPGFRRRHAPPEFSRPSIGYALRLHPYIFRARAPGPSTAFGGPPPHVVGRKLWL